MSVASKRRFVTKQVESELVLPEREDIIAQILGTRGNNLHEVFLLWNFRKHYRQRLKEAISAQRCDCIFF